MPHQRYEITGEWSGYRPSQQRVVHREYTTDAEFAQKVKALGIIRFTDNTVLYLNVRKMKKGERRQPETDGYYRLIRNCVKYGVKSVEELNRLKKEAERRELDGRLDASAAFTEA